MKINVNESGKNAMRRYCIFITFSAPDKQNQNWYQFAKKAQAPKKSAIKKKNKAHRALSDECA